MAERNSFWDSKFGGFLNNILLGIPGAIYSEIKSAHLTGAEREQNAFNAEQALLQREFEAGQVQNQMNFQAQQAAQQIGFQERMANTQWQRGVADMQKAGLNPALAYGQGGAAAPSGVAMQGAAASGVAASGSGRGIPMSMSDIVSAMLARKQMKLIDAQASDLEASAENKRTDTLLKGLSLEWNPKIWASEIGLRESTQNKLAADVESVLASAEGQRIYNQYSPQLFESQLVSAEVNRSQMIASIARMQAEIEHFAYENAGIRTDIEYKHALMLLTAAQTALTNMQTEDVSTSVWQKSFANDFQQEFGFRPDQPIWNDISGLLGKFARVLEKGKDDTWNFIGSIFKKD